MLRETLLSCSFAHGCAGGPCPVCPTATRTVTLSSG